MIGASVVVSGEYTKVTSLSRSVQVYVTDKEQTIKKLPVYFKVLVKLDDGEGLKLH